MLRAFLALALWASTIAPNSASASCACTCVDGNVVAGCTSDLDIPPICAMRTCTQPTIRPPPPLGARHACLDTQVCDQYGHCEWKPDCR